MSADVIELRPCVGCGVPTYTQRTPVDLRPEFATERAAREMCWSCYDRERRAEDAGEVLPLERFRRQWPCPRCGIDHAAAGFCSTELCRDCVDEVTDLGERAAWGLSDLQQVSA